MGVSTDGILAYGYDLGGGEDEWKIQEADEYGELHGLSWFDPTDEEADFIDSAVRQLRVSVAGFTEEWSPGSEGYWERERAADAQVGVEFTSHCSADFPMYLLAAKVIRAHRGWVEDIDMADLADAPNREGWDAKLEAATRALGITPTQDKPKWVLVSDWG